MNIETQEELDALIGVFGLERIVESSSELSAYFQKYADTIFNMVSERLKICTVPYAYEEHLRVITSSGVIFSNSQLLKLLYDYCEIVESKEHRDVLILRILQYRFAEYFTETKVKPFGKFASYFDQFRSELEAERGGLKNEALQWIFGNYRCQVTDNICRRYRNDPRVMFHDIRVRKSFETQILNLVGSVAYIVKPDTQKPLNSIYDFMSEETFHDVKEVISKMIIEEAASVQSLLNSLIGEDLITVCKAYKENHRTTTTVKMLEFTFDPNFEDSNVKLKFVKNRKGKETFHELNCSIQDLTDDRVSTGCKFLEKLSIE